MFDTLNNVLETKDGLRKQAYMNGAYLKIGDKLYNIFPCSRAKLLRIHIINDMFKASDDNPLLRRILKVKKGRVLLFETLDSILKYLSGRKN